MKNWKKWVCGASCALMLTAVSVPAQAAETVQEKSVSVSGDAQQTKPPFQNPHGMTVDLIYWYEDAEGAEKIAGKVQRAIIPAGTAAVTVEMQQKTLPEGYSLKEARDLELEEDTVEVKIQVVKSEEKPTEPAEKPTEPTQKPTEPAEKPTEPAQKPTEPAEKPTEPTQKPAKPAEKPQKPNKPSGKPDATNPQTRDSFPLGLWMSLGLGSAGALLVLGKKKLFS